LIPPTNQDASYYSDEKAIVFTSHACTHDSNISILPSRMTTEDIDIS
jgi:hypothetical protein